MFVVLCVWAMTTALSGFISLILGHFMSTSNNFDDFDMIFGAWMFTIVALGISLTVIMYQNGVII